MAIEFNKHIIKPKNPSNLNKGFYFTPPLTCLLSFCSNISKEDISKTKILCRSRFWFVPWYNPKHGGGAITLGNLWWRSITFTENFFSTNVKFYGRKAYGSNTKVFVRLAAHEVGHVRHIQRYKFLIIYLMRFAYEYARHGHAHSPLELEAEISRSNLLKFEAFIDAQMGHSKLWQLIESDSKTDEEKLSTLKEWIRIYKKSHAQ